jgi:hypothetical protein
MDITVVCTVEAARVAWLPQFVRHYQAQGLERFHLTVQCPRGKRRTGEAARRRALKLLLPLGVDQVDLLERDFDAMALREHHDEVQDKSGAEWLVWADIDEFQVYPAPVPMLVADWKRAGIQACTGLFVDRVSRSGKLAPVNLAEPIWGQYPIGASLTRDVLRGQINKVVCSHVSVRIKHGNHEPVRGQRVRRTREIIPVFHFKWDSTVVPRLKMRLTEAWKKRCPWWTQTARLYEVLEGNRGRLPLAELKTFDFRDDALSREWHPYRLNARYGEWFRSGRRTLWGETYG